MNEYYEKNPGFKIKQGLAVIDLPTTRPRTLKYANFITVFNNSFRNIDSVKSK